jgi:hypothetical protein
MHTIGMHAGGANDEQGPEIVLLDQVPGCYGSVRFDHRLHVGMSSIGGGCTNCHHDAVGGASIRKCKTCHDSTSSIVLSDGPGLRGAYHRQCLGCHREWAHQNACGFCHQASSTVTASRTKPVLREPHATAQTAYVYQTAHKGIPVVTFRHDDHSQVFGLKCADCHGGDSCTQCHGPGAERPIVNRQQTCYTCHSDAKCVTCHDLTERGRFDHGQCAGWRFRPGHKDLACVECHTPGKMPQKPTSEACRKCHATQAGGTFDHSQTGVVLSGDHEFFECVDCHAGGDDRVLARCTACHSDREVVGKRVVGWKASLVAPGDEKSTPDVGPVRPELAPKVGPPKPAPPTLPVPSAGQREGVLGPPAQSGK